MRKSLKRRALKYVRNQYPKFVNAGELERLALENGYKGSTISRELRHLTEEGLLEREEKKNPNTKRKSVWYKAREPKEVRKLNVVGMDKIITKTLWD